MAMDNSSSPTASASASATLKQASFSISISESDDQSPSPIFFEEEETEGRGREGGGGGIGTNNSKGISTSTSLLNIPHSSTMMTTTPLNVTARQEYEKSHLLPGERYCSHHKAGHPIEEFGGNYLTCKASRLKKKTDRAKKSATRRAGSAGGGGVIGSGMIGGDEDEEGGDREMTSSSSKIVSRSLKTSNPQQSHILPPLHQHSSQLQHRQSISPNETSRTPLPSLRSLPPISSLSTIPPEFSSATIHPTYQFAISHGIAGVGGGSGSGSGELKRKRSPGLEHIPPSRSLPSHSFTDPSPSSSKFSLPTPSDLYRDSRPNLHRPDEEMKTESGGGVREPSPSVELYRAMDTFKSNVYSEVERVKIENRNLLMRNEKLEQDLLQQNLYIQNLHQRITELERFPPPPSTLRDRGRDDRDRERPILPPIMDHRSSTR